MVALLETAKRVLRPFYYWGPKSCSACGRRARMVRRQVMWPELGAEWDLSPELYDAMSERDGLVCPFCGSTWRARFLAKVFLEDVASNRGVSVRSLEGLVRTNALKRVPIAEINAVSGLHPFLAQLPLLYYSEYGSRIQTIASENLMSLSYAEESFDYVLTSDTLEHVPDFDQAMSEIGRVLKPGGKHIFTIPVIWERVTRQRALVENGEVRHLLPPSYHAGPQPNRSDYLVFYEFGGDVVERIKKAGFAVSVEKEGANPLVCTLVAERIDA